MGGGTIRKSGEANIQGLTDSLGSSVLSWLTEANYNFV